MRCEMKLGLRIINVIRIKYRYYYFSYQISITILIFIRMLPNDKSMYAYASGKHNGHCWGSQQ